MINLDIQFCKLIKDPWKITGIHDRGLNIGIDKYKINSDNKLKIFYLVSHVVGKDHIIWFHDGHIVFCYI